MPKGPGGEKRPADVIGGAMKVMRNRDVRGSGRTRACGQRRIAAWQGAARARNLSPEIAKKAAARQSGSPFDMFIFLSSYEAAKMNMGFDDRHLF